MMMGWIGVTALAAHQIALTCAATTFMFPLGVAMAVTIRIGHAVGAHEFGRVRPIGSGALFLSAAIMGAAALLFFFHGPVIASWFVVDETTRRLTAALFIIAAIFQIFDGLQVVAVGALRGLADVKVPMAFMFTAYWIIALPFGYLTAFTLGWGPAGIWGGLAIGLAVVSSLLVYRFLHKSGRLPGLPGHPI
jgi:MATE family multidrug resistance protein